MKFFIDTANLDEIKQAADWGILDGVTTNPTLIARENAPFKQRIIEICEVVVPGPVSAEVVSLTAEEMIQEARELNSWAENIAVKIPLIPEGIKATRALSQDGIACNVTLCFTATQALLAAKAGAAYISPFIGRLDDVSTDGMSLVEDIVQIYDNYAFDTEIIVASIRHPIHVLQSALLGAHIATIPFDALDKLFKHHMTDIGLESFLDDWNSLPEEFRKR
ncbi:MAG: fructose-6-phosphate aldolase [Armatimonadota bacterium]|jgi:transaldolase